MTVWRRALFAALAVTCVLGAGRPAPAVEMTITTEVYPPYNMLAPDGSVTGASTDILHAVMERAGVSYGLTLMPWQRAYAMAKDLPSTCVYSTSRTEEREPLFLWVGPLVDNDWVLFGREDGPKLASLEDARDYTIGGYDGDATGGHLAGLGFRVVNAPQDHLNVRKLTARRIDFWATGRLPGLYLAAQEGAKGIVPVLTFREVKLYLACSLQTPRDLVDRLNAALGDLRAEGALDGIEARYR